MFRDLEKLLGAPHSLVLRGDYNTICDARVDYDKKSLLPVSVKSLAASRYRLEFPSTPSWTWSSGDGSSRLYIVLIRKNINVARCPLFRLVCYSHRKMLT